MNKGILWAATKVSEGNLCIPALKHDMHAMFTGTDAWKYGTVWDLFQAWLIVYWGHNDFLWWPYLLSSWKWARLWVPQFYPSGSNSLANKSSKKLSVLNMFDGFSSLHLSPAVVLKRCLELQTGFQGHCKLSSKWPRFQTFCLPGVICFVGRRTLFLCFSTVLWCEYRVRVINSKLWRGGGEDWQNLWVYISICEQRGEWEWAGLGEV